MSQPPLHHIYYAIGYGLTVPGIYFNRVLLAASLDAYNTFPQVKQMRDNYVKQLEDIGPHYVAIIQNVFGQLQTVQCPVPPLPRVPNDYFTWMPTIDKSLRAGVTRGDAAWLLYNYGYELGNLTATLSVYEWAMQIQAATGATVDMSETITRLQEDIRNTHFRSPATAALLGQKGEYVQLAEAWQPVVNAVKDFMQTFGDNKPDTPQEITAKIHGVMATCAQVHSIATTTLGLNQTNF